MLITVAILLWFSGFAFGWGWKHLKSEMALREVRRQMLEVRKEAMHRVLEVEADRDEWKREAERRAERAPVVIADRPTVLSEGAARMRYV